MNKKAVSTYLAIAIMATLLAGCGGNNDSNQTTASANNNANNTQTDGGGDTANAGGLSEPGVFPIVQQKETISVVAPETNYILDLSTNDFFTAYEEKTNVHVEFEQIPEEAFTEKRNLKMGSGDLPDAFLYGKFTTLDMYSYGSQGTFVPLNDYIEKQGYEFKKVMELQPELPAAITAPDGNIYGIPRYHNDYHSMYYGKAWINKAWLDKLGLAMPTTTDELITVLEAFKTQDPNGNGQADEIPMTGSENGWFTRPYEYILNSFVKNDMSNGTAPSARLYVENGKVDTFANKEEFKQGLQYTKDLLDKGLLDSISLTQTYQQLESLANNPEVPIIGVGVSNSPWVVYGDADVLDHYKQYVALPPLKGPNGLQHTPASSGMINGHLIITSAAKNPELIFKWGDGMLSEEMTMLSQYGPEETAENAGQFAGKSRWKKAEEGHLSPLGVQAVWETGKDDPPTPRTQEGNETAPNVALYYTSTEMIETRAIDWTKPIDIDTTYASLNFYKPYVPEEQFPEAYFVDTATADEYSVLKTDISNYVIQNINAFITGNKSFDKDWDSYVKGFDNLNLARYLEISQQIYDDYIKNATK